MSSLDDKIRDAVMPKAPVLEPYEKEMDKKKALLQKVQQLREDPKRTKARIWASDPGVGLPADKVFVWVNRNEHRVVEFTSDNYTIVKDGTSRIHSNWVREDGTHIYGDLILMEVDKDWHEAMKLDDQLRALQNIEGEAVFETFAKENRIPVQRI